MTREETQQAIKVMQAFVDGKPIQSRQFTDSPWKDIVNPFWDFDCLEYRIKPSTDIEGGEEYEE